MPHTLIAIRPSMRRRAFAFASVTTFALVAASGVQARAEFLPHQALYDLSLATSRGSTALDSATGRILYNFTGSVCEGYATEFRQVSELEGGEGKQTSSDLRSVSWEEGTGKSYRFKIETRMNDDDPSVVDGIAERVGDKVTVTLKQPEAKTFTIDGDTVFPTQQVERILQAAREGKTLLQQQVYDGSDNGEKVYNTMTVIGQPVPADKVVADSDPSLTEKSMKGVRRWPVSISYFDRDARPTDGEQTPVYSMAFELFDNGVSRALKLDYNAFAVAGALSRFSPKEAKPCKK